MVRIEIVDKLGYIYLNRPEKKNAFNPDMIRRILDALDNLKNSPLVKVVILASTADVFCAGADLEYLETIRDNSFEENVQDSKLVMELFSQVYQYPKLIIAQIEGHAIAGGCGLLNACDYAFAVPEAKMGYTEVRIGFTPAIVSIMLIRKIGEGKARDLLLSGRLVSAEEAHQIGLVNELVTKDKIKERTVQFASELADSTSADSIRVTKELLGQLDSLTTDQQFELGATFNAKMRETSDFKRGINAFLAKEKISW